MLIAIDAGHGKNTAGKRCMKKIDKNETREHVLNDRIADKLQTLLKNYDCSVLRVDDTTGKTDISLSDRVNKANKAGAAVYISIHHNAGVNGGSGGGTVVYYYSSKNERKTQAIALYNALVKETGLKGNRSSKVINYPFYVIKHTKMPSFLIENGFMDSTTDVPIILSEDHATKSAKGILNFLVSKFDLKKKAGAKTETEKVEAKAETKAVKYRVQCGAFSEKAKAEALQKKLKKAGFEAVIVNA